MNDSITLVFDSKTLDVIANALAQRPFIEVAKVLDDIGKQVAAQQAAKASTGPQEALNGSGEGVAAAAH